MIRRWKSFLKIQILVLETDRMRNKKNKSNRKDELKTRIVENKRVFTLYIVLRLSVILIMIAQFFNGNYENFFLCILTLILFTIPSFIEKNYHIDLPDTLEVIILLFIYSAEILGELRSFYVIFPFWDTMLHTLNGFLAAAIGFSMVDILNRNKKSSFQLSPFFMALVAFCFSMTIGVLWEFFECGMDIFFHMDMQKDTIVTGISSVLLNPEGLNRAVRIRDIQSTVVNGQDLGIQGYLDIGLLDTMKDLFVNFIGAVVFSTIGYFYVKTRGEGKFAKKFIPHPMDMEALKKKPEEKKN